MGVLLREDEAGTSSSNESAALWWIGMMMRWDGAIHLQQLR
jgi:hypothetical protein